jgi:flagellar basal-body rod modification protein FlgD
MNISTDMSPQDMTRLNYQVDSFNKKLQEDQKIVSKNTLGEADFMKLLITQLKSQDPTKPLEDKEFIGQMAQFTSLKQMNQLADNFKNLNREFSFTKAVNLVNKTISWTDENGKDSTGLVESIRVKNGDTFLNVDGQEVTPAQIKEVFNTAAVQSTALSSQYQPTAVAAGAIKEYEKSAAAPAMNNPEPEVERPSAGSPAIARELETPVF